jgi:hypothetical protein
MSSRQHACGSAGGAALATQTALAIYHIRCCIGPAKHNLLHQSVPLQHVCPSSRPATGWDVSSLTQRCFILTVQALTSQQWRRQTRTAPPRSAAWRAVCWLARPPPWSECAAPRRGPRSRACSPGAQQHVQVTRARRLRLDGVCCLQRHTAVWHHGWSPLLCTKVMIWSALGTSCLQHLAAVHAGNEAPSASLYCSYCSPSSACAECFAPMQAARIAHRQAGTPVPARAAPAARATPAAAASTRSLPLPTGSRRPAARLAADMAYMVSRLWSVTQCAMRQARSNLQFWSGR